MITNLTSTGPSVGSNLTAASIQASAAAAATASSTPTPQIILGPSGQQMGFLASGPQGTFFVNQVVPGLSQQPILIQGNLGNVGGPLQLTLRPQQPQVVAVSSANVANVNVTTSQASNSLISALTGQNVTSNLQKASTTNQPQTLLIPNQGTSVSASSGPTMIMTSGQPNLVRHQNIILTRPQNLIGTPSSVVQNATPAAGSVPQFLQIQTPNGQILVALQTTPTLNSASGAQQIIQAQNTQPVSISNTIMPLQASASVGQQTASTHPTLHTILQASSTDSLQPQIQSQSIPGATLSTNNILFSQPTTLLTSHSMTTQPVSLSTTSNKLSKSSSQAKSVNLAELLKETGILQDTSPPSSPPSSIQQTSTEIEITPSLPHTDLTSQNTFTTMTATALPPQTSPGNVQQPTELMMSSQSNQGSNILFTPSSGLSSANTPQLRLSLAPDGSVILQPNLTTSLGATNNIIHNNQQLTDQLGSQDSSPALSSLTTTKFIDNLKDSCGPGSSQPSPDSTTPTLDASTPTSTVTLPSISLTTVKAPSPVLNAMTTTQLATNTNANNSNSKTAAILQHLNSGHVIKTSDSNTSVTIHPIMATNIKEEIKTQSPFIPLTVQNINSTNESSNEQNEIIIKQEHQIEMDSLNSKSMNDNSLNSSINSSATAVISMNSCDNLVQTSNHPVLLTNTPLISQDESSKFGLPSSTTCTPIYNTSLGPSKGLPVTTPPVVDQNGVPVVQISLNNQEFIERLESQVKSLSALKSPTNQQKQLLQELLSLQKKMLDAKVSPQSHNSSDGKVILTNQPEQLVRAQQQLQQQIQQQSSSQSSFFQSTQSNFNLNGNGSNVANSSHGNLSASNQANGGSNLHLLNLLKPNQVNQGTQLRLITPANANSNLNGSTTFQVGNQLITITTSAKAQVQTIQTLATNQSPLPPQTLIKVSIILKCFYIFAF